MGIFIGSIVGLLILVIIIIVIRIWSKGSILASLRGGVPLIDRAGTGKICELIDYEINNVTNKVRLRINYFGGGLKQTGFWFDPNIDFYPSLDKVAWENYMGTIICYKDLETGQRDYRQEEVRHLTEKNKALMRIVNVYKKVPADTISYFEKQKIDKEQEKEPFLHSKALNAIKKLSNAGEEVVSNKDLKDIGLVDE